MSWRTPTRLIDLAFLSESTITIGLKSGDQISMEVASPLLRKRIFTGINEVLASLRKEPE